MAEKAVSKTANEELVKFILSKAKWGEPAGKFNEHTGKPKVFHVAKASAVAMDVEEDEEDEEEEEKEKPTKASGKRPARPTGGQRSSKKMTASTAAGASPPQDDQLMLKFKAVEAMLAAALEEKAKGEITQRDKMDKDLRDRMDIEHQQNQQLREKIEQRETEQREQQIEQQKQQKEHRDRMDKEQQKLLQQLQWQQQQQHQKEQLQMQERLYNTQQQNAAAAQHQQQQFILLMQSKGVTMDEGLVRALASIGGPSASLSVNMPSVVPCPAMPSLMAPRDVNNPLPNGQLTLPAPKDV